MKATLDEDRKYLGFAVRDDCTTQNGRIYNAAGESPFHLRNIAYIYE